MVQCSKLQASIGVTRSYSSVSFLCALERIHTYLGVRTLFVRVAFLFAVVAFLKFPDIVASHPLLPLKTSLVCIPSLRVKQTKTNKTGGVVERM